MKRDTDRKNFYEAKLHEKKAMMRAHLSKELKAKLGTSSRALLINKGDSVKVMRGSSRGKSAKVARVSYSKLAVYLEGFSHKNAKGSEILIAFHPSNLMLTDLNPSKDRKGKFKLEDKSQPRAAEAKAEKPEIRV